jgi:hypothetical protein
MFFHRIFWFKNVVLPLKNGKICLKHRREFQDGLLQQCSAPSGPVFGGMRWGYQAWVPSGPGDSRKLSNGDESPEGTQAW